MEAEIYYDICFEFVIGEKYSYSADAQCHETDPVFTANLEIENTFNLNPKMDLFCLNVSITN